MEDPTPFHFDDDHGFQRVEPIEDGRHRIWGIERAPCPSPLSRRLKPGTVCRCRTKTCRAVLDRTRGRDAAPRSLKTRNDAANDRQPIDMPTVRAL